MIPEAVIRTYQARGWQLMSGLSIRTEARILALINTCDIPEDLLRVLDPGQVAGFSRAAVEIILAAKQDRPHQRFTSFAQIQNLLPQKNTSFQESNYDRYREALERFQETAEQLPEHGYPVLLFPVRLETRFTDNKLLVRIYPDQISIHSHEKNLTLPEYEAAKVYRTQFREDQELAWRVLCSAFGPARATWIAEWVKTHRFRSGEETELPKTKLRLPRL